MEGIDYPVVVKCSGLAAGKGVLIPTSKEETIEALKTVMVTKATTDLACIPMRQVLCRLLGLLVMNVWSRSY